MTKRVLVMANGTGGHVMPALAMVDPLREAGFEIAWLGTTAPIEQQLLAGKDFPIYILPIAGVRRPGTLGRIKSLFSVLKTLHQAIKIVRQINPDIVIGMGGVASGPGGLAAWLLRKPLVVHEQNAIPGVTNRILARFAARVLEAFPKTFSGQKKAIFTGNPIRHTLLQTQDPHTRYQARKNQPIKILILGGSQGARALNEIIPQHLNLLSRKNILQIRHQAGGAYTESTRELYETLHCPAKVEGFIEDMASAYEWADLVIGRAGSLTLAEIATVGVASVLVPLPQAADNHQFANAKFLEQQKAAIVIEESVLANENSFKILQELIQNREALTTMAVNARKMSHAEAGQRVLEQIQEVCCD